MTLNISNAWFQKGLENIEIKTLVDEKADKLINMIGLAVLHKCNQEFKDDEFTRKYIDHKLTIPSKDTKEGRIYEKLFTAIYDGVQDKQEIWFKIEALNCLTSQNEKVKKFLDSFVIPEVGPLIEAIENKYPGVFEKPT